LLLSEALRLDLDSDDWERRNERNP
jgi:hypothetical protein